jgi:MOSC domain-containing protein YiiM
MAGRVHQINVSNGGVPKLPVEEAMVGRAGVSGDDHDDKIHHGGPDQTVCIFSLEVIDGLRSEGHPIFPGAAGENLTVAGIDWSRVEPGARLRAGDALLEVTFPTTPCAKNAQWFRDADFNRMNDRKHPGWSRMYARVLTEGRVRTGDPVDLLTPEEEA